ncbi:hypothetical protein D9619_007702 [Psilocybe cf. subviscida]|uniref:Uncharacterized protein n=1 Tax=Psilocybe cf. subviscida TaxID=2480587 RepID=A0A8H5ATI2_9AGAR|nr:hypothetical protein D9619_007702 [Psilocybe cf. subviscida]
MYQGSGVVKYAPPEGAQRVIRELPEQPMMEHPVFIREDRETRSALAPHLSQEKSVRPWLAKALHDLFALLRTTISVLVFGTPEDVQQAITMYHEF